MTSNFNGEAFGETYEEPPKRIVSGPTLYCIFALGVILVGVGTFITANGYLSKSSSAATEIFKIVGPIALGSGGICLLIVTLLCVVACSTNKQIRHMTQDDLYAIGGSTFYNGQRLVDKDFLNRATNDYGEVNLQNISDASNNDPIQILAETVVNERIRNLSKNITSSDNTPSPGSILKNSAPGRYDNPHVAGNFQSDHQNKTFQERKLYQEEPFNFRPQYDEDNRLRRVPGCESLGNDDRDCDDNYKSSYLQSQAASAEYFRNRSLSMIGNHKPAVSFSPSPKHLRRNVTLTTTGSHNRRTELRNRELKRLLQLEKQKLDIQKRELNFPPELQYNFDRQISTSLRKKKKPRKISKPEVPEIFQLPNYNPGVVDSMIDLADKSQFRRSLSFESLQKLSTKNLPQLLNPSGSFEKIHGLDEYRSSHRVKQLSESEKHNHEASKYLPPSPLRKMNMGVSSLRSSEENILDTKPPNAIEKEEKPLYHQRSFKDKKQRIRSNRQHSDRKQSHNISIDKLKVPVHHSTALEDQSSSSNCSECEREYSLPPEPDMSKAMAVDVMKDLCTNSPQPVKKVLSIIHSSDNNDSDQS